MSLVGKRQQIADALSTVEGVTGYPYQPTTARAGDAWPLYQGAERDEDTGMFAHNWSVGVALPQDEQAANTFIDAHLDAIDRALLSSGAGYIDRIDPANFGNDNNIVYGLVLVMRSE